jgi:colanic acid/amylovoran biosynthesis glycosyltransferase
MKIAFLVGAFPNWTGTFILNQITGLLDRGQDVDIYATEKCSTTGVPPEIKKYNLLERTFYLSDFKVPPGKLIHTIRAVGLSFKGLIKNPNAIIRSLKFFKHGKKAFSLELLYKVSPYLEKSPYDITYNKISPFLGKRTYDIIHCHYGPIGKLGVLLKDIGAIKGKVIVTFYGFDIGRYVKNNESVYKDLFEKGDLFIALSNHMKEKLIELGCNKKLVIKHPLGVNPKKFTFKERKPSSGKPVRILTVARLTEKKGLEYSIKAFAKVAKSNNVEYSIVGDGILRNKIESLIANLKIEDKVKMLGWKKVEEIRNIFDYSDIFILSSVTARDGDAEGTPTVLLEAMSSGLPVISTYHTGIPEQVQDGKSGFLVPERDVDSLAEKIQYLIEHPELWPEMGKAGRKFVEENYDIEKLNDRLVGIYRKLIDEDKPQLSMDN